MPRLGSPRLYLALAVVSVLTIVAVTAERSPAGMAAAATRFLNALSPEQREQAKFEFAAAERSNWHYIPRERKGLPIKGMSEPQRKLARALLTSGLSERGALTALEIMQLETILGDLEKREGHSTIVRDPELYFFSVFGTPAPRSTWGWRVEGHHLSLNFTVANGEAVASAPTFFGSNPAEVPDGPRKGFRVIGAEEDAARALLKSLDDGEREQAVIGNVAPKEIVTGNAMKVEPLSPVGLQVSAMTSTQRDLLVKLIDVYTGAMAPDIAADRMVKLRKAGLEKVAFAWAGKFEHREPHYYRIQGPTFLVEYDNTQNDANHIHSVWRDFDGDFGADLLREHLKSTPH